MMQIQNHVTADFGLGLNYFVTKKLALTANLTSLASYDDSASTFKVGFNKVDNPLTTPKIGLIYKF